MVNNGITKSEIILGTHLSKTTINSVLSISENGKNYMFGSLLKVRVMFFHYLIANIGSLAN